MILYPKLVESKTSSKAIRTIEWNPAMDLLATVFENNTLTCCRLLSLQKVWSKEPRYKIVSVAWRPDGRVLAIASFNNISGDTYCTLHDVEDGKEIHSIIFYEAIHSISWNCCSSCCDRLEKEDPIRPKKSLPMTTPEKGNFSHQLAHEQTQLNLLVLSTPKGFVRLYALGLFYLGRINLGWKQGYEIHSFHMSSCMRYIACVFKRESGNLESGTTNLRFFDIGTLHKCSNEILKVAKIYAKITDELEYLDDTLSAIKTSWADVLAGLDNKLSSYYSRRKTEIDDSTSEFTFISSNDLMALLIVGNRTKHLEKFLVDMSDKGLRKLNNAIEQTCQRVQTLIVKNAQKCCYHLHNDLNVLNGMSLWRQKFGEMYLTDRFIVIPIRDVGSLMLKLTELQQVIGHTLKSAKSFFRWLVSIAARMHGEQNNGIVQSEANKTTQQDIQLITDFILENFDPEPDDKVDQGNISTRSDTERPTCSNFTLEQVGQYFKDENLSRLKYSFTKSGSNFWIEFLKQRPRLCHYQNCQEDGSNFVLFYPHHENASLIQDYKNVRGSIDLTFVEFSKEFSKKVDASSSCFVNLVDFLKGAPGDKVRVNTDISSLRYNTLFQLSEGLVNKQYLISLSLKDKSCKIISIEFRAASATNQRQSRLSASNANNILIADSCFYEDKGSKTMLLTFLLNDQTAGDTLLTQVELNKLLDNSNCVERLEKDLIKILQRPSDQLDRYSSPQTLKIDLHTEAPHERMHEPEMMVKKIKGILGKDMFASSKRGVIAFTSSANKRLHIYELDSLDMAPEMVDDEVESDIDSISDMSCAMG